MAQAPRPGLHNLTASLTARASPPLPCQYPLPRAPAELTRPLPPTLPLHPRQQQLHLGAHVLPSRRRDPLHSRPLDPRPSRWRLCAKRSMSSQAAATAEAAAATNNADAFVMMMMLEPCCALSVPVVASFSASQCPLRMNPAQSSPRQVLVARACVLCSAMAR